MNLYLSNRNAIPLPPKTRESPALLFALVLPVCVFLSKSLLASLFLSQQHGFVHLPAIAAHSLCRIHEAALLSAKGSPGILLKKISSLLSGGCSQNKIKNISSLSCNEGSTNMPLFGRAHKCKECEHWSEKKV